MIDTPTAHMGRTGWFVYWTAAIAVFIMFVIELRPSVWVLLVGALPMVVMGSICVIAYVLDERKLRTKEVIK